MTNSFQGYSEYSCSANSDTQDAISDVTSRISHEIRTPLTSIRGVLGLLHTEQLGSLTEEGKRLLAIAINNADRLTRLADTIEYEPPILSSAQLDQLQLQNDLRHAIARQELYLLYQPIVEVKTGQTVGFEALARWQHPTKGLIPPDVFIPLAEKLGLIHTLDIQLLETACQQLRLWQQQFMTEPPLTVSVNLSPLQLLHFELVDQVRRILEETGIAPNTLKLEITESALMEDLDAAIATLLDLQSLGVQLCIDDFGTGYSSLARLQDLPLNTLKLDRSFVHGKKWDISEAIILLASRLGLQVVAEGVETPEELAILEQFQCSQVQGYLFSKPIDPHTAEALITTQWRSAWLRERAQAAVMVDHQL